MHILIDVILSSGALFMLHLHCTKHVAWVKWIDLCGLGNNNTQVKPEEWKSVNIAQPVPTGHSCFWTSLDYRDIWNYVEFHHFCLHTYVLPLSLLRMPFGELRCARYQLRSILHLHKPNCFHKNTLSLKTVNKWVTYVLFHLIICLFICISCGA